MTVPFVYRSLAAYLLASSCIIPLSVRAQIGSGPSPISSVPATFQSVDSQGVDLASGNLYLNVPLLSIGTSDDTLAWSYKVRGNITTDNVVPTLSDNIASVDASSDYGSGPVYINIKGSTIAFTFDRYVNGANSSGGVVLKAKYKRFGQVVRYTTPTSTKTFRTKSGSSSFSSNTKYEYTDHDGIKYTFIYFGSLPNGDLVDNIRYPNGNVERYYYDYLNGDNFGHDIKNIVISVENSFGMQLHNLSHHAYVKRTGYQDSTVSSVAVNKAYSYCDPQVYACNLSSEWPRITIYDRYTPNNSPTSLNDYSTQLINISDTLGKKYTFNYTGLGATQHVISYLTPAPVGMSTKRVEYNTNSNGIYSTVAAIRYLDPSSGTDRVHSYNYLVSSGNVTTTVIDPLERSNITALNLSSGAPSTITDKLGHVLTYSYDGDGNISTIYSEDGSTTRYVYDNRGNPLSITKSPKTGSDLQSVTLYNGYDTDCNNPVKCNKPNWTKDAAGNETDYTYTADGFLESVTAPAAVPGGVRPQVRYTYVTLQAYLMNSSGTVSASGQPITLLSQISRCRTQAGAALSGSPGQGPFTLVGAATCAGSSDETIESIDYGPQQVGTPNNLWPVGRTIRSGDGSIASVVIYSYDKVGNMVSEDGPQPGTADKIVYTFDRGRQLTGMIGPDPDGGEARKNGALRYLYGDDGQVLQTLIGTVNSSTDTSWSSFTAAQQFQNDYDALGRKTTSRLVGGGAVLGVTQYSYDAVNRLDCVAVRMNAAQWNALPTSACSRQLEGDAGPDRITKYSYDRADRQTKVTAGYGSDVQADSVVKSFTDDGQIADVRDALGNLTSYSYDGFNRLASATFANGQIEKLSYDQNDNVVTRLLRDGTSVAFEHDRLGRIMSKTLPNGEGKTSYDYDLLGHPLSVTGTTALTYEWDALGRMTRAAQPFGTVAFQYDNSGNRTQMSWADGFYVDYTYDDAGNMLSIKEKGGAAVATFGYDDFGRRTSILRGNGVRTTYRYDAASNLAELTTDLAGSADDQNKTFFYNALGQITSQSRVHGKDAFHAYVNVDRHYTVNALNQYTGAGGLTFDYDGRGNLSRSGSSIYTYSAENLLSNVDGNYGLQYDGAGRLIQYDGGGSDGNRFVYDGGQIAAEVSRTSGALQRRYVFGPSDDEPLVEYDASGAKTYLVADERGSITARTDASGVATATNGYDEFGIPNATNEGRFQYTGQVWLPEYGFSYYKARIYSSSLGRFLQPDPLGYAAGLNWYAYGENDPINNRDPSGMIPFLLLPPSAIYAAQTLTNSAYFQSFAFDDIVVTAFRNRGFSGMGSFNFNQYPVEPLYYGYADGSTQDSQAKSVDTTDTCGRPITQTGPTVKADPTKKLAFIAHLHEGNPTRSAIESNRAHFPYPGPGDGITPALRQIPNYTISKIGVTVVRPGLIPGSIVVDRLTPKGYDANSMPREAYRALAGNALNAYNARRNPTAAKVNPCR